MKGAPKCDSPQGRDDSVTNGLGFLTHKGEARDGESEGRKQRLVGQD